MARKSDTEKPFRYGGQAVYEGVMIRGKKSLVMAVRAASGNVVLDSRPLSNAYLRRLRRIPFLRGIVVLGETLVLGTQALMASANMALGDEEQIPSGMVWGTVVVGLALGVGLFLVAPLLVAKYLLFPYTSPLLGNILEGLLRIGLFVAYLRLTRLMPEVKRIYAYHGAEHKAVNAYEHGVNLEPGQVRQFSTAHTRCGTGFLLIVLVIAIIVYALAGRPTLWVTVAFRVLLLPVIVGIGYELMRWAAEHQDNRIVRALIAPGLALQSMTTAEPADDQLEVALAALNTALAADSDTVPTAAGPVPATPS